jgi:two-component system, LytTR family, response regulator AlgR
MNRNPERAGSAAEASLPRVLIVDDEAPARSRLAALLSDIAADFPHQLVGEAGNGHEALARLGEEGADIVLLDVQMPEMTGLELARHLAALPEGPSVVFVSAYDEYALKAFEVHALDYLVKPVRGQRLLEALQRAHRLGSSQQAAVQAAARAASSRAREFISVHERGRVRLIAVSEILYFKAELKYVTIRTPERQFLTEESLVALEEEFAESFVRVHRNALVARLAISGFERVDAATDEESAGEPHWEVVLKNLEERLPVSRRQWPIVKGLIKGHPG